jgi:hypothetical protein
VRSGPGAARTILLFHIISARPSKQPRMERTFLKVYMELGSYFLFLQEQIKDIIIIIIRLLRSICKYWLPQRMVRVRTSVCTLWSGTPSFVWAFLIDLLTPKLWRLSMTTRLFLRSSLQASLFLLDVCHVSHRVGLGQIFSGTFGELKTTHAGVGLTQQID